jgi:iron complex outermembrane receptor protein
MSDFQVAWVINYIHGTLSVNGNACNLGLASCNLAIRQHVPSWVTHDLQVNYDAPWNGRFTIGVRNIGDKDPPMDPANPTGRGFDTTLYDLYGRVPYFRYRQSF